MKLAVMAIKDRNGKVELFKTKNEDATVFKDKFTRVHFLDEGDRSYIQDLFNPLIGDERKSVFAEIEFADNTNDEGEKNNSYWTSKKTEKYNERFFIVKLTEVKITSKVE